MISVIIPLYNKESTIKASIESVLTQSYKDIEVIIVDDGSTDNSVAVVETISDKRLILIRQKNSGPGAARNAGAKQAKGEWIVFLDADDGLCEKALQTMHEKCIEYNNADIIDFNKYLRINNELVLQEHPLEGIVKNPLRAWYFRHISPGCGHSIFRTTFVLKHPYKEYLRRYEDAELLLQMLPTAKVYSSSIPTEIHNMDTAAASVPRKNIKEDYVGYLSIEGSFWHKMCTFRLFIEERENYPEECRRLYSSWYKKYNLLLLYKLLNR